MKSRWLVAEASAMVADLTRSGISEDMALLVYSSRLLGGDSSLVLHGGGNTSVKTVVADQLGDPTAVMLVKGSGRDMAVIEPAGLPAVRLEPLLRARLLDTFGDEDLLNLLRTSLLDARAPTPSVETLTHAFLPHKYVAHSHSSAILALSNQADGENICRDLFDGRAALVPYRMPGFRLARMAAEIYEADSSVTGLVLLRHGLVTFGACARDAYERMIALVTLAEDRLAVGRKPLIQAVNFAKTLGRAEIAPILRGALAEDRGGGDFRRRLLDFRTGPDILAYLGGVELERYSQAGVVTPDHVIRTKGWPLIAPLPLDGRLETFKESVQSAIAIYMARYQDYFERNNSGRNPPKKPLDSRPQVVLVPGLGLFGVGGTAAEAAIAADIAISTIMTIMDAEAIGRFESIPEPELFDMEYWSLEQAKLGDSAEKPLARQVVLITGGAGTIGRATAAAFLREGAEVAVVDLDEAAVNVAAMELGPRVLGVRADVTCASDVRSAFDQACARFGGVDIVVSNAGVALQGRIGDLDDEVLRRSFEINFFAHQTVSQNAVRVMRLQGTGGALLYNVSKQAVNPGPDFGAYGLPKAATLFLVRQYALDHGRDGIRANGVNADRIRGGMLTAGMIADRSAARSLDERAYMAGNLLAREVSADDVAQAFVHQALALRTTASITTVDGGNIAAALR